MSPRPSRSPRASHPTTPGAVQVWVRASPRSLGRWLGGLLAIASLGGGLALLGLSFRLGLQLILDPDSLPQVLAPWQRSGAAPLPPATSLAELRQQAEATQQRLGEPLRLGVPDAEGHGVLVVPMLAADSGAITSLTLFQAQGEELRAIATLAIDPLPQDTVMAPWLRSAQAPTAVPQTFPLSQVVRLPPPPLAAHGPEGTWLTLQGTWQQQGLTLRYGQLLYVDPQAQRLDLLEPWSSPVNRLPQWADLDGDGPSDWVIDETVDLEPTLRGVKVTAGAAPRLQSVSWVAVPVDAGAKAEAYHQALKLARGGLWSQAQAQLLDLKTALAQAWNPTAEAQLRLMERHAAITRQQADQDWSTPTQHILALLIDGRWEAALAQLEASPELLPTVLNRLGGDRGRMWSRISAAAALPTPPPAVYVWGGLALKAQQNQPTYLDGATQDWLTRQPIPAATRQRLARILTAVAAAQAATVASARETPAAPGAAAPALEPLRAIIGQGKLIPAPGSGFAGPGQSLEAWRGQWYAVELRAIDQGQGWQSGSLALPAGAAPAAVWSAIAPATQAAQVLGWVSPTHGVPAPLTVRGLTLTNGTTLLATGPAASGENPLPPLVFSQGALLWLDDNQSQVADAGAIAAPVAAAIFGSQAPPADFANALAHLSQHRIDLTGDGQPEQVLTWKDGGLAQLQTWQVPANGDLPKTMILDANQRVLYNDLVTPQTLVALTNPALGGAVGLLVYRAGEYELLSWEAVSQRFE